MVAGTYSLVHRQASVAAIPFGLAMFSLGIFSLLAGIDIFTTHLELKIILMRLRLSILPLTTIVVLVASIQNAQRAAWLSYKRIGLLSAIPIINLAFAWIPSLEKYLRHNYQLLKTESLNVMTYANGPWFWVILVYSGLVALIIFGIQFNTLLNSKGIYFKQTLFLVIGQIIPATLIILLASGQLVLPNGYNYGPHALMLTALLNGWAIYRHQWNFSAPVARDIAIDLMSDIMLVVNESGGISDANASARKVFRISDLDMEKNISNFIPKWGEIRIEASNQKKLSKEVTLSPSGADKIYELTVNPANHPDRPIANAYVLVLREITEKKRQQEQMPSLVRAVSQSPNSVLITDPDGIIEYVNPSFTRLTGYSAEEAIGQTPGLFKSGQTPNSIYKDMWQTIKAGKIWKGDLLNRGKDGNTYWEETLIAPLFDQYGQVINYISIKEDISARKEVDEILHRRLDELMMVNVISMAAASQLDLTSLVSLVGQQLEQTFNARSVLIALHNQGGKYIEIPYWTIDKKRVQPPKVAYGEGLVSHILKTRKPLLISNNFQEKAPPLGYKSVFGQQYGYPKTWLGVPIISGEYPLGVISLQNYATEFAYNDDDVRLLTTIAASIGVAIDNARLYHAAQQEIEVRMQAEQEARERANQMSVLYEVGHALSKELELNAVLDSLMNKCRQIAPVDVFSVGLYDQENEQVKFIKVVDNDEEQAPFVLGGKIKEYVTGEVIKRQITIYIPDSEEKNSKYPHLRHITKKPIRTYLGIPLFYGNKVTGVLSLQSYQKHALDPQQVQTLEIIATQAAVTIENARLYEVARRRADEMSLLYDISLELTGDLDTKQVLRNLLIKCREILPMDSFYVSIYDERNQLTSYPLFYDRQNEFLDVPPRDIRVSPGLTGEVIMSAKTIYLPDTTDPKTIEQYQILHVGGTPTRSFVGVPMIVRDKVVGVISMQAYLPNSYEADDIRLFETIAAQAAIAVENSRLYGAARTELMERREAQENLQLTNQELQVQLQQAESTQETLREQAIRDSLTGLFNRRYLDDNFPKKIKSMKEKKAPLAVMMLDIDHFKIFNDTYGHTAADELLVKLGQLLRNHTRQSDIACRYGGEEFVVLLANTNTEIAIKRAEQIRQTFENSHIDFEGQRLQTTISIGISIYPDHGEQSESLLIQADQALYQAKSSGRNLVVAWTR